MKNKSGFTLIELLAIIVVLTIIAVITIPIILNVIESSKQGTVKSSAYGYKNSIDNLYYTKSIGDPNYEFDNKRYSFEQLKNLGVSISGQEPETNSWVDIVDNGIIDGCLQFGDYMVNMGYNYVGDASKGQCDSVGEWSQTVFPIILKSVGETIYYNPTWIKNNPIYYNPVDNSKCSLSDSSSAFGTSSGCMKWYAYSETKGKVNMLLDHNLVNEEWGSTNQVEPDYLLDIIDEKTSDWNNKLVRNDSYSVNWNYEGTDYSFSINYNNKKARLISAEEVADVTGNSLWSRGANSYYFGSLGFDETDEYLYQDENQQFRQQSFSWLFDNMHECDYFGCENAQSDVYVYWTSTPKVNTDNEIWCVCNAGCIDGTESNVSYVGLRPVISVSKSTVY